MTEVRLIESEDDVTVVALSGRLDIEGVDVVGLRFTTMTSGGRKPTIVDMSRVDFIASLGLGMLVREAKALAFHGARMVLLHPSEMVEKAVRASGIDRIIPVVADLEAAQRSLRGA